MAFAICDYARLSSPWGLQMIWFAGDPHGRFDHIVNAVKASPPSAVILLGDMECSLPLDKILRPILDLTEVWFIPGNHDADSSRYWDNLIYSGLADRNLHGQVVEIDGMRVAGLGGVFEESVWLPGYSTIGPQNYLEMVDQLRLRREPVDIFDSKCQRYKATIFPDDYFQLAMDKADILVTHQAPSFHRYGIAAINELVAFLGATHLFHGHYHEDVRYADSMKEYGFEGYSVGFRSIIDLTGSVIYNAAQTAHESFKG